MQQPPRSPSSPPPPSSSGEDEWLRRFQHELGTAALRLGGFHHLSWNRRIVRLPDPDVDARAVGLADWDGTLYVHERWVVEPLGRLRASRGRRHGAAALRRCKEAIATLLHETYHMAAPADHDQVEGRGVYDQPSSVFLEEGVTELYTHHRLDDVIRAAGVDAAAPGICDVRIEPSYPDYAPGTRRLLTWTADRLRMPYVELLESLTGQTAAGKYPELSRLLLVRTGLAAAIPPTAWWACLRELEQAVRTELDRAAAFPPEATGAAAAQMSVEVGARAAGAVDEVLTALATQLGLRAGRGHDGAAPTMEVER